MAKKPAAPHDVGYGTANVVCKIHIEAMLPHTSCSFDLQMAIKNEAAEVAASAEIDPRVVISSATSTLESTASGSTATGQASVENRALCPLSDGRPSDGRTSNAKDRWSTASKAVMQQNKVLTLFRT